MVSAALTLAAAGALAWLDGPTRWDHQVLDVLQRLAIARGRGPALSPDIVYLTISDASYRRFAKQGLDRTDLARINTIFTELGPDAVAFDMIFARPGDPSSDQALAASLNALGCAFLPAGFAFAETPRPFAWEEGVAFERLQNAFLQNPRQTGQGRPLAALRAMVSHDPFAAAAAGTGHISAASDPDGVYRHMAMLIKVDEAFLPALSLSVFLKHVGVGFDQVQVNWGRSITVPALKGSGLAKDLVIPIDARGRAFIPFARTWAKDFAKMEAHSLLTHYADEAMRGNLIDFFEGKIVLVADVATGAADIGQTPLEDNVPLVAIHAALLNGMLTGTFYTPWTWPRVAGLVAGGALVLGLAACLAAEWVIYPAAATVLAAIGALAWQQMLGFHLLPPVSATSGVFIVFFGLVVVLKAMAGKEKAFIRSAFSRYLPPAVVRTLLADPQKLALGGEERVLSVLFSDLAGFTSISEKMTPAELVGLLNAYLTEMTAIVLANGGIIDKYQGDAIMAEFGAPLPADDHADRAVATALQMQQRLVQLRRDWSDRGLPALQCRIGINTGPVILGNMGSDQVFDYTVMGDAVNLASRLEGANKNYGTFVMVSQFTHEQLTPGRFATRLLDVIKVKGKQQAVKVYHVYGTAEDPLDENLLQGYTLYEQAVAAYLERRFDQALDGLKKTLALIPEDLAAERLIARIQALDIAALPADWDGALVLTSK